MKSGLRAYRGRDYYLTRWKRQFQHAQRSVPRDDQTTVNISFWKMRISAFFAALLFCCLASCTTSPTVSRKPDGSYMVHSGNTFMASRSGVVAEVKTAEGDHIKYLAKGEDSTKVPTNFLRTAATVALGWFANAATQASETTAQVASQEATKLGTVQSNNATAVAIEGIKADVTKATFVPP